jgi:hypothetical protein
VSAYVFGLLFPKADAASCISVASLATGALRTVTPIRLCFQASGWSSGPLARARFLLKNSETVGFQDHPLRQAIRAQCSLGLVDAQRSPIAAGLPAKTSALWGTGKD